MIYVVGLGPGGRDDMTSRALSVLEKCDVLTGYRTYIDLIRPIFPDKDLRPSSMGDEESRCREALEISRSGRTVALVSSGDAGVYGMAGLMLEIAGADADVEIVPGMTAATTAAAVLGAPLMNDFAVISLSDLLTPQDLIERRLLAAAEGDLTICLYNPASRGRPDHLRRACGLIMRHRPADTPAGWVRNIGRDDMSSRLTTLGELADAELDMFCTVIIGCSRTAAINGKMVTRRGYERRRERQSAGGESRSGKSCAGRRLLMFGGTSDAREMLLRLPNGDMRGGTVLCCVATEYGAELIRDIPGVEARVGRLDAAGMESLIRAENPVGVVDATHPYAAEVTANIRAACERTGTELLRVVRSSSAHDGMNITRVSSCDEAAELLNERDGKVLLTVGSKQLAAFTRVNNYRERLYARVLPASDVLRSCEELGFDPAHIIAMQGPFSRDMNAAMLRSCSASVLVTKDGGSAGGTDEKFAAAAEAGVEVILVARPDDDGLPFEEALLRARRLLGAERPPLFPLMTDIEGCDVLVVGGGNVASRRAQTLLKCGARVRAVAPVFCCDFPDGAVRIERAFEPDDIVGAVLVTAASDDREVNALAGREARRRGIPVSVADAAGEGSFFFPSLIESGGAAVSVSSAGMSCSLTRRLSDRLRAVWPGWVRECASEVQI